MRGPPAASTEKTNGRCGSTSRHEGLGLRGLRACAARLRAIHLYDTDQAVYKHSAVGLGTVDFGVLPAVLSELGFARRPILEIIADDPDDAIERSARHLYSLGVHPAPSHDTTRKSQP